MHGLELLALLYYCMDCCLQRIYYGRAYWAAVHHRSVPTRPRSPRFPRIFRLIHVVFVGFSARRWTWMKLSTLSLLFINMVLVWGGATTVSIARALRPILFLERLRNVRRIATNIVQVAVRRRCVFPPPPL